MKKQKWFERNHEILLAFSMLVVCLAVVSTSCYTPRNIHKRALERRCMGTLRSYGETQLAYQNTNNDREYGSWHSLIDTEYLARGYTRTNLIEGYSLWTNVYKYSSDKGYLMGPYHLGKFTVVAFPYRITPPGYLRTFAIREDQVLRNYLPVTPNAIPWGSHGDFGARTWAPVQDYYRDR